MDYFHILFLPPAPSVNIFHNRSVIINIDVMLLTHPQSRFGLFWYSPFFVPRLSI